MINFIKKTLNINKDNLDGAQMEVNLNLKKINLIIIHIINLFIIQRRKNLGSRVALLPGKFLRVRKVFARIKEKPFKLSQYFQNDPYFSR